MPFIFPCENESHPWGSCVQWYYTRQVKEIIESESHSAGSNSLRPHGLYNLQNSPGQNTGVCSLSLLQGVFPIQRWNPGLPHCRRILYQLSHKGSPRVLEWVAYSFSSRSSWPKNQTGVSCIAGRFFTNWAISEAPKDIKEEETKKYFSISKHK